MIHIAVEGMDGTGKSTLVKALFECISVDPSFYKWVYQTKEPGNQTVTGPNLVFNRPGLDIRNIVLNDTSLTPLERELLFYVDASQHRRFINDQQNAIVISDRGIWSHHAYLYATMKIGQIGYEDYLLLRNLVNRICPIPSSIIYLKGDVKLMRARLVNKTKDLIESNGDQFFQWVQSKYEELEIEPQHCAYGRLVLDATNSTSKNVEEVISFLKEAYTSEELKSGNLEICRK